MANKFAPEIIKEQDGFKAGVIEITWLSLMDGVGWGNGYVSVPKDHPWYGKDYNDIEVEIHGGLTFSESINDEYWIGFDCAHYGDSPESWPRFRVETETISLLNQALLSYYPAAYYITRP